MIVPQGIPQGIFSLSQLPDSFVAQVFNPNREMSEEELYARFLETLPFLVEMARRAREKAISWRNFQVGCALLAFRSTGALSAGERLRVFTGANMKVAQDVRTVCAEAIAIGAARAARYDRITAMVICGTPQKEDGCPAEYPTLHPCRDCRALFRALPEVRPNTRIITITPNGETFERYNVAELLESHKDANGGAT